MRYSTIYFEMSEKPARSGIYTVLHKFHGVRFWAYYDAEKDMWGCYTSLYDRVDKEAVSYAVLNRTGVFQWCGTIEAGQCKHCGEHESKHTLINQCIYSLDKDVRQRKVLSTSYEPV